jgi:hypothetical protein
MVENEHKRAVELGERRHIENDRRMQGIESSRTPWDGKFERGTATRTGARFRIACGWLR